MLPPGYINREGNPVGQNPGQEKMYAFWVECAAICDEWQVDTVILVGDLIQGLHRKGFGAGNVLTTLDEQAAAAIELLAPLCEDRKVYGVSGTEYHDSRESRKEKDIIETLGGEYCGYIINGEIEGTNRRYNIAHGASQSMIYRETVAAREVLFMREAEALGKLDHYDAIIRGHNHIFRHLDLPQCHYVLNPCWQALRPDNYTLKNYAKMLPDIGMTIIAVDTDDRQHILHWLMPEPVRISDYVRTL
jgi:predicted MPP superfamily phosphohydrolase